MGQNLTPSLIKDINPGAASSGIKELTSFNGNLAFIGSNVELTTIFQSDGTTSGTVPLSGINVLFEEFPEGAINSLITGVGNKLFFTGGVGGGQSSRRFIAGTDGTRDGTSELFSLGGSGNATGQPNDFTSIVDFEDFNGNLAFAAETTVIKDFGRIIEFITQLTISDGTEAGTSVIKTFNPGEPNNVIGEIAKVNGTLFFTTAQVNDSFGSKGAFKTLWKSDGTEAGTNIVTTIFDDIMPGKGSSIDNLTDINGNLFFTAAKGEFVFNPENNRVDFLKTGIELFKSDGTQSGTVVIKDINPGEASSNPDKLTDVNGIAFFTANDGSNGIELWKSDGTQSGTVLVKDIISGSGGSNPDNLTNVNGTLFFTVNDGSSGTELWKSDGTQSGTSLVKDINPDGNSSNPDNLTNLDGILYFTANDGSNGVELWKSDGTQSGTVLVGDINPGSASSNPQELTVVDGELYFSADDGVNGRELWGLTEDGTQPKDLILGTDSNDVLLGKEQDNIIDGLKGNDTLTGGSGKDTFVLSSEFGNDLITDFTLGEDEIINATSRIVFTTMADGDSLKVAFSNTGDILQVNLNGNGQSELENYLLNIGSNQNLPY